MAAVFRGCHGQAKLAHATHRGFWQVSGSLQKIVGDAWTWVDRVASALIVAARAILQAVERHISENPPGADR